MAMNPPSPATPPESLPEPRASRPAALMAWLAGLSWVLALLLIPLALLALGLEAGLIAGRPHG